MSATKEADGMEIGEDLVVSKPHPRDQFEGSWIEGTLNGHKFNALVFKDHADDLSWELLDSRISKLWVQRLSDSKTVFNWDRGMDVPAEDRVAQTIVEFLCAGLAEHVYSE
jgi:hypothetical protein